MFPIGNIDKKEVRKIALEQNLATAKKKDSTGICFIGERNFKNFLSTYIESQKGNFVRLDDQKTVGTHDGMCFYTIGQRKGLGLGGPGGPWFVSSKDKESNTVYVVEGEEHQEEQSELNTGKISYLPHYAIHRVNLANKVAFTQATDGRVAGHHPNTIAC